MGCGPFAATCEHHLDDMAGAQVDMELAGAGNRGGAWACCVLDQTRPETRPTHVNEGLAFASLNIKYLNCVTLRASK